MYNRQGFSDNQCCRGRKDLYFLGSNTKSSEKTRSIEHPRIRRQSTTNDMNKNQKEG